MTMQVEQLQALAREQRELIKKLLTENQRLNNLTETLRDRVRYLEQLNVVIDGAITDISIDFDLIPERDKNG